MSETLRRKLIEQRMGGPSDMPAAPLAPGQECLWWMGARAAIELLMGRPLNPHPGHNVSALEVKARSLREEIATRTGELVGDPGEREPS
jgi:hypothetical protein